MNPNIRRYCWRKILLHKTYLEYSRAIWCFTTFRRVNHLSFPSCKIVCEIYLFYDVKYKKNKVQVYLKTSNPGCRICLSFNPYLVAWRACVVYIMFVVFISAVLLKVLEILKQYFSKYYVSGKEIWSASNN